MSDITYLNGERADRANDNRLITAPESLRELADQIERGERSVDGMMVLIMDRGENSDEYNAGFRAVQLCGSEMIALLEVAKSMVLEEMGYT